MKRVKVFLAIIILLSVFIQGTPCFSMIPEPDNIFYGWVIVNGGLIPAESHANITLKVDPNAAPIASYTMGSNPIAGDFYILRVPIYAHASEVSDGALPGDTATIYVNDELAGIVIIVDRGNIQMLHLDTYLEDTDQDGLTYNVELYLGTDPNIPDTDNDELTDGEEAYTYLTEPGIPDTDSDMLTDGEEVNAYMTDPLVWDTDNDGHSDGYEINQGTNPLDDTNFPATQIIDADVDMDCDLDVFDLVFMNRHIQGFSIIVPSLWRQRNPNIPSDAKISNAIEECKSYYNIDTRDGLDVFDLVIINRYVQGFSIIVPSLWRIMYPEIPPDTEIAQAVEALKPKCSQARAREMIKLNSDTDNRLHIENIYGVSTGQILKVPVYLDIEKDLFSMTFDIMFDPTKLEATALEKDTNRILVSLGSDAIDNNNGRIIINILDFTGETAIMAGQGKLLDIEFQIKDLAQETTLRIEDIRSVYNVSGQSVSIYSENGKISALQPSCYLDADGDGYGDPNESIQAFPCPEGYVEDIPDCDDNNENINPEATETCNEVDDDCDTEIDEEDAEGCTTYFKDADQDGYGLEGETMCLCYPDITNQYTAILAGDPDDSDPLVPDIDVTKDMNLSAGWSMISLPVNPVNSRLSDLFPGAAVVYGYKKEAGYTRVKKEDQMEIGKGYWILVNEDKNYSLTGRPVHLYTHTIQEDGWSMIGGCSSHAQVSSRHCTIGVIYGYVQGTGYERIKGSENLQPCEGYWILFNHTMSEAQFAVKTITIE